MLRLLLLSLSVGWQSFSVSATVTAVKWAISFGRGFGYGHNWTSDSATAETRKSGFGRFASLQLVFRLTALAKLLYAAPSWWGFANAGDRNRLEGFLRRAQKAGYYNNDSLPTVAAHCDQADEQLFSSLQYCYIPSIRQFLPPERNMAPSRPHNCYLPQKLTSLDECNYMFRVL